MLCSLVHGAHVQNYVLRAIPLYMLSLNKVAIGPVVVFIQVRSG